MAKFCPLFSSSSGNSTYISSAGGGILVDVGMSAKQLDLALLKIGAEVESIKGIFITHEHSDHIKGLRVFALKHKIPVFASEGTLKGIRESSNWDEKIEIHTIDFNGMEVANMEILPFHTSHDSFESNGYRVTTTDGRKIAIATDLGIITKEVKRTVLGCDLVLLESNHDIRMLENGPYFYGLKRRILSDIGHLSNDACAKMSRELIENGTTRIILGHLSRENNLPVLAFQTTLSELNCMGAEEGKDFILKVASPINEEKVMVL